MLIKRQFPIEYLFSVTVGKRDGGTRSCKKFPKKQRDFASRKKQRSRQKKSEKARKSIRNSYCTPTTLTNNLIAINGKILLPLYFFEMEVENGA